MWPAFVMVVTLVIMLRLAYLKTRRNRRRVREFRNGRIE
jgi:hypothetical protein